MYLWYISACWNLNVHFCIHTYVCVFVRVHMQLIMNSIVYICLCARTSQIKCIRLITKPNDLSSRVSPSSVFSGLLAKGRIWFTLSVSPFIFRARRTSSCIFLSINSSACLLQYQWQLPAVKYSRSSCLQKWHSTPYLFTARGKCLSLTAEMIFYESTNTWGVSLILLKIKAKCVDSP